MSKTHGSDLSRTEKRIDIFRTEVTANGTTSINMERTFNEPRDEVIESALNLLESYDRLSLRFSFNPISENTTKVVIVIPDITMPERNKQQLCAQMFDEPERR